VNPDSTDHKVCFKISSHYTAQVEGKTHGRCRSDILNSAKAQGYQFAENDSPMSIAGQRTGRGFASMIEILRALAETWLHYLRAGALGRPEKFC
jgi:hypothetical protein